MRKIGCRDNQKYIVHAKLAVLNSLCKYICKLICKYYLSSSIINCEIVITENRVIFKKICLALIRLTYLIESKIKWA